MKIRIQTIIFGVLLIFSAASTILITSPIIKQFSDSKIIYSYANFGKIPYGKTLTFLLNKTRLNLCQSIDDINHLTEPTYLLVDASFGTCSFTVQSINAQNMGAKGIIFVSDTVKYNDKIVQADDGNGRKVKISALFISVDQYKKLHGYDKVNIKVLFDVHKTNKVAFSYFLSASGRQNYIFLREFLPYFQKIKDFVNLKPIYITFDCKFCSKDDCFIDNKYCNFEIDKYQQNMGSAIIREQLRQWNIWKKQGTQNYLLYMDQFDKYCTSNWFSSEQCGKSIMKDLGLKEQKFTMSPTQLMDEWRMEQVTGGFISTPQITINQQMYAGTYEALDVFTDICANLKNRPEQCNLQYSMPSKNSLGMIIGVVIGGCLISLMIGFIVYRKCIRKQLTKDMFSKVNQLVAHYATKVSEHNKKRKQRLKMRLTEQL